MNPANLPFDSEAMLQGLRGWVECESPTWDKSAVERMLDEGPLARKQFGNLRVYKGPNHPHEAQKPEALDVGALNPKNKRVA